MLLSPPRECKGCVVTHDAAPHCSAQIPQTECLLDVRKRVAQVWDTEIVPAIRSVLA